ncbi:MAG: DUF4339 domain-containing protein [Candidatus Gracilibacteria bacterium]|nr:DUF4339 domain-containing protein [Candidatus Gracilibacteria bacterium]
MKKYFYIKEEKKLGPFDFEELKSAEIKRDTLVWVQGIKDWTKASEVSELSELFIHLPPPIPNIQTKIYRISLQLLALTCLVSSIIAWFEIESIVVSAPIVVIISLFAYYFSDSESKNQRVISLIPIFISLLCFLMILVFDLDPGETITTISVGTTISIGTLLFIVLTFDKIKHL